MKENEKSSKALDDLLKRSDEELSSNWPRMGSLIMNFEGIDWKEAQEKAQELVKNDQAIDYVQVVRESLESESPTKQKQQSEKSKTSPKQTSEARRDRFSKNYDRLMIIAPGLDERLLAGEEVFGKSKVTGYMDFNLELLTKNQRGYYVAISHYYKQNGDMIPDPDMVILVDVENQIVEALTFDSPLGYSEVYDNYFNPKAVTMEEKKSQNAFLETWFRNLIKQGHVVKFRKPQKEPQPIQAAKSVDASTTSKNKAGKRPDISYMDDQLIAPIREMVDRIIVMDDMIELAEEYGDEQSGFRPIVHFFMVDRVNRSPLGVMLSYPDENEIRKDYEKLVEQHTHGKSIENEEIQEDVEEIAKNWPKLAAKVREFEGLDYEAAKQKALELIKLGKAEAYVERWTNRLGSSSLNDLFKACYSDLLRFMPILEDKKLISFKGYLKSERKNTEPLKFENVGEVHNRTLSISFEEIGDHAGGIQIIGLNHQSEKAWLVVRSGEFMGLSPYYKEKADFSDQKTANNEFRKWIKQLISKKYKIVSDIENVDDWDDDVNSKIPDFEPGKVELVEAHKKVGIKQKDIDWINKHQRGMILTPVRNMNNKTKSFEADMAKQAMKPGFRISKTGKLYRENRSNRSDLTDQGI